MSVEFDETPTMNPSYISVQNNKASRLIRLFIKFGAKDERQAAKIISGIALTLIACSAAYLVYFFLINRGAFRSTAGNGPVQQTTVHDGPNSVKIYFLPKH